MREIKFAGQFIYRIWCSNDKRMLYTHDDVEVFAKENVETKEDVLNCVFSDTSAQRSTEIKDMHGKEIYEGDIFCYVTDEVVENIGGYDRFEPEGHFVKVVLPNFYYFLNDTAGAEEIEIVGNIYENPDLIVNK